jgi:hypothetical protein
VKQVNQVFDDLAEVELEDIVHREKSFAAETAHLLQVLHEKTSLLV